MNDTLQSDEPIRDRPSPPPERFTELMDQARRGSQEAAEQVWQEYGPYVVYVVRRWLRPELRGRLDSQDFAQDVWASFFKDLPAGEAVANPDDLVRLLAKMARNKVVSEYRRSASRRRDFARDESHGAFAGGDALIDPRAPTPSQVFAANALVADLTLGQPESAARMVRMRCDGLSDREIAERERTSTRTVRRVFEKLRAAFFAQRSERRE